MWPFRKKRPRVPFGDWVDGKAVGDGRPVYYEVNVGLGWVVGHPDYAHLLAVVTPLREPGSDGLGTEDEAVELDQNIGPYLGGDLGVGDESVLVLVITTGGVREWVFYTRKPQAVERVAKLQRRYFKTYSVQASVQHDPDWSVYRRFVP